MVCHQCGQENPDGFRFCGSCGAELAAEAVPAREVRKTVTVLFCDLAGYTSRGESLDPEALRRVQSRYFEDARTALERHGGTVEKFIGDAVMAVFGIPQLHEDDALRALKAAVELRQAVADLELQARIGVNTGEVVAGSGDALVTGDAVNVAARLEQAAPPGEILIGEQTLRLCRDAIRAEPVEPLDAKGKTDPLRAYRLLEVRAGAPAFERRLESPLVGREDELAQLRQAWARAVRERRCHLFTVLGSAGIGKSRLVTELAAELGEEARFLAGRCLPYGEGITYWPLVDIFRGLNAEQELATALSAGISEETFLAVRRFLEALARDVPLLVVFEDVHWAEPTLLDLIEHIADWSREAPILLVCLARPELLDVRSGWGGGKVNASTILLEPLPADECESLIAGLLGETPLSKDARRRIVGQAEGNPLFVEQMVALLSENGAGGSVSIPPTIQALIAARLDRLPAEEREVAERASVIGKDFERAAVAELAPEALQPVLGSCLLGLVRKELIQPYVEEDAFRFASLLIRDAAYEAMPKELRAELHERFAGWLDHLDAVPERDEIVGYHLEHAYRYREELGPLDNGARELGGQAATRLAAAGRRAYARSDMPAAANLVERAAALLPEDDPQRLELLPVLGSALMQGGDLARAEAVLTEALERAQAAGDVRLEAHARLRRSRVVLQSAPERASMEDVLAESERAIRVFEESGDDLGLGYAWYVVGLIRTWLGQAGLGERAFERSIEHAARAGSRAQEAESLIWLALSGLFGPTPAAEGIRRCEEIIRSGSPYVESNTLVPLGALQAMCGRLDEGRETTARGRAILSDLGLRLSWGGTATPAGMIEFMAGDPAAAERVLREGYEHLEGLGERGYLSTIAGELADAVFAQGRHEEALHYAEACEEAAASDDLDSQVRWRCVRAKVMARRGEVAEAERLAREAVELVEGSELLMNRCYALMCISDVLQQSGSSGEAVAAVDQALELYEAKGNVVDAERARALLAELRGNQPPATA